MNPSPSQTPLVWLSADYRLLGEGVDASPFALVGDEYTLALRDCAQVQPLLFPHAQVAQLGALLQRVDGVLLTGSPSNIHPSYYGQTVRDTSLPQDPQRDGLNLALVRACIEQAVPLLGICRGFQEINVALGGSLHQAVHQVVGFMDHREPKGQPLAQQYGASHTIDIQPSSLLAQWAGTSRAEVNSLHGQGIDRLAAPLEALAWAPDGLVEAVRVRDAPAFAYGVEWHPEWACLDNAFYGAILRAFGDACRARVAQRSV